MKYTTGGLTNDNRGSIGGVTFSQNKSSKFARAKTYPSDPRSLSQYSVRAMTAYLSMRWKTIARTQIAGWVALASTYPRINKLGVTYYLSGQQMFMHLNRYLQSIGTAISMDPPSLTLNVVPTLGILTVNIVTTPGNEDIILNFQNPIPAECILLLDATTSISPGVSYPTGYKRIAALPNTFVSGTSVKLNYVAVFGRMFITNEVAFFKARLIDNVGGFQGPFSVCRSVGTI